MSEIVSDRGGEFLTAGGEASRKRTCNRHDDCDAAQEKAKADGRNPYIICCNSDDCEDCFGS